MSRSPVLKAAIYSAAVLAALSPGVRGDTWNKKTIVTLPDPVEVPGTTLQPGKYVLKLLDSPSNRNIVQISNEREDHVYATVFAIPTDRRTAPEKTILTFYEMPKGQPEVLRAWFYQGDSLGREFAYPKRRAAEIARATHQNVPDAPGHSGSGWGNEPVTVSAANVEPAASPDPAATPQDPVSTDPQTAPGGDADRAKPMPRTASQMPLIALLGFLSLMGASTLRLFARRIG